MTIGDNVLVFQIYAPPAKKESAPLLSPANRDAAFFLEGTRNFIMDQNFPPQTLQQAINIRLRELVAENPQCYKKAFLPLQLNAPLDAPQTHLANEFYNTLVSDSDYRTHMASAYSHANAQFSDSALSQTTAMVSAALAKFASNFNTDVEVHLEGQLLTACTSIMCISFNLIEEMKKIENAGALKPEIDPVAMAANGGDARFSEIFGKGAKEDLAAVMKSVSKVVADVLRASRQPEFFASKTAQFQQSTGASGSAIADQKQNYAENKRRLEREEDEEIGKKFA